MTANDDLINHTTKIQTIYCAKSSDQRELRDRLAALIKMTLRMRAPTVDLSTDSQSQFVCCNMEIRLCAESDSVHPYFSAHV
ncbi:MAG: hypothetical protein J07HQW2_00335 [Haloquadratum walsbyi J07HQW2]|uniref:Uncharacterized protein n=1 Tax=Haloquadratum walsbyi J07HQW2 TaxID=1238425 RepID=U1PNR7_9EURY|nr:MAG: hypothetical protein J07HQW2_00335 [Haloquadratum walsbyi J07HQW2]